MSSPPPPAPLASVAERLALREVSALPPLGGRDILETDEVNTAVAVLVLTTSLAIFNVRMRRSVCKSFWK